MTNAKALFANISLLIALAYMFDLWYRYLFQYATNRVKYSLTVTMFILGGWCAMLFGPRTGDLHLLDLRIAPLMIAVLVFPRPAVITLIGLGIGIGRLFFDFDGAAVSECLVMILIGLACTWLSSWLRWKPWRFLWKSIITVLAVNILYTLFVTLTLLAMKLMPVGTYLLEYGIYSLPLRILLSALLMFIVSDFQKEQLRVDELRNINMLLRRQTRELREAKRDVEEKARELLLANKYKSEFLANMSHELKTPLNSIILLSQLMQESDENRYSAEDVRYADLINGAGNDLLQLINDILDLSKVEAGKMDINIEPLSIEELVQTLHQQFLPVAGQKKLLFETEIAPHVPDAMQTDPLRLNQILRNLLVNAFKFTESGSVKLVVKLDGGVPLEPAALKKRTLRNWNPVSWGRSAGRIVSVSPQRITFSIIDTGIGIEMEKQKLIFEAFQQEDGSINRNYGGTGLGLSISLQLARLLGGTLSLESRKGEGSRFTLRLPLMPPSVATTSESSG
ncbi:sensor histidine kinase [Paenibacillus montanisoli]|uniref:Circadian input-output histidine kinase CikA n=1 Tax=Paenibacillus montanisoli TaxID=2081970 RepID=A0A328TY56_9BACL|nr:ATP-binding protein [Paenibacillus montanisoli]RAP74483.1 histidine kinase [Paenibacillus montanisoli]